MKVDFEPTQTFTVELLPENESVRFQQGQSISVGFGNVLPMDVAFTEDRFECALSPEIPTGDYSGPYEVTPDNTEQTLPTRNRTLDDNIVVHATPAGSARMEDTSATFNPIVSVDEYGNISATVNGTATLTPTVVPGYVSSGTSGTLTATGSTNYQLITRTSDDMTVSGQTVTAPNGYYPEDASKSVPYTIKPIIFRPDAEIIKTYSYDKMIVADEEITIPAYTTTATVLKASENLADTITLDYANYNYYVVERMLSIPSYSVTSKAKGRVEWNMSSALYEIADIPANTFASLLDPTKKYTSRSVSVTAAGTFPRLVYWSTTTAVTAYATAAYGTYQTVTAPTITSGVLTVKTPAFGVRGHATYFSSTYFNALTDIRNQWVIEVWKAPKDNLNVDGWSVFQNASKVIDCLNTGTHKLT